MRTSDAGPIRLLLVDDHEIVRMGLRLLFERYPELEVIGEAGTASGAVQETMRLQPEVVLMDVRLPDGTGVDACREIRSTCPNVRVLFLTSFEDEQAILATIFSGAHGFFLKEVGGEALVRAIMTVADGQPILDPAATRPVLERMKMLSGPAAGSRFDTLSPQERRVLSEVAIGKTNKQIAQALQLSDKTVKNYVSRIFHKLNFTRRSEAAAYFIRHGAEW